MNNKKSIRFYNDYEFRAVWDEENSKWWFSATDIARAINDEEDYKKAGNYLRWLKKKLTTDGIQLVSVTHEFKFQAPEGKQRTSDALDAAADSRNYYSHLRKKSSKEHILFGEESLSLTGALRTLWLFCVLKDTGGDIDGEIQLSERQQDIHVL